MPDVLGDPPSPRAAVFWNGTAWQWALVDAAGHLQLDVVTSGLPAGAATAAAQALALAQLQLIEDMRDALQSVATDRLIVRGEDQLFSYKGTLHEFRAAAISGADGYVDSQPAPAGEIWVVTNIVARDRTTATTEHEHQLFHDGGEVRFGHVLAAMAADIFSYWSGWIWLDPSDTIRVYFLGGLAGDTCHVHLTGYIMTLEA